MKNYYGFSHLFGSNMHNPSSPHGDCGVLHVFSSKADRDEWVSNGPAFVGDKGARTAYPSGKVRAHLSDDKCLRNKYIMSELIRIAAIQGIISDKRK